MSLLDNWWQISTKRCEMPIRQCCVDFHRQSFHVAVSGVYPKSSTNPNPNLCLSVAANLTLDLVSPLHPRHPPEENSLFISWQYTLVGSTERKFYFQAQKIQACYVSSIFIFIFIFIYILIRIRVGGRSFTLPTLFTSLFENHLIGTLFYMVHTCMTIF